MKSAYRSLVCLSLSVLCLSLALPLKAATIIFDNTSHDLLTQFNPGTLEVGDEIILAPGTERNLIDFSFEYWGANSIHPDSFTGTIDARVQFYLNDGTPGNQGYATPGTSFYDSGWFSVEAPTTRSTFDFTAGVDFPAWGLVMPAVSNMTWSVQFVGMGEGDTLGVDIYSPPTVGQDYPDYWQNGVGGWTLMTNTPPMDFAAKMTATVPEPSTLALAVCGGLGLLVFARRFGRKV
jgi:hypothetical protein